MSVRSEEDVNVATSPPRSPHHAISELEDGESRGTKVIENRPVGVTENSSSASCSQTSASRMMDDIIPAIARLKEEQRHLREERKRVSRDLKNQEKRRSRLKKRAKMLSDGDLMAVLQMRHVERAHQELEASQIASTSNASSSCAAPATESALVRKRRKAVTAPDVNRT